jgi:hypothetical protein
MEGYADMSRWMRNQRPKRGLPNFLYARYADDFVVLCRGTKGQAEAMKQELSEFLEQELKLTLSWEKTKVTHVTDGFEFLGFQFVGGMGTKGRLTGKVRIPESALKKAVSKAHIILSGSTEMSVNTKIRALNAVIRGWCQYYQYTSSPHFMFRQLEYKVFWLMAHWLGKKYKLQMPEVMRRFRKGNTFGTATATLVLPTTFKSKPIRFKNAPNPYSTESQDPPRYEEVLDLAEMWTGIEARAGAGDIREAIFIRDRGICGWCGMDVEWNDVELDHIRPRITFKDPGEADTDFNLWILHRECHRQKTAREQLS